MARKRHEPTVEQLDRRVSALKGLLEGRIGVEAVNSIPASLQEAKDWNEPRLGIRKISSPNSFTRTNKLYGDDVREIEGLVTAALEKFGIPKGSAPKASSDVPLDTVESLRAEIEVILKGYHSAKQQATDAAYLSGEVDRLTELISLRDIEIARLKRQMAGRGVRPVK